MLVWQLGRVTYLLAEKFGILKYYRDRKMTAIIGSP